MPETSHIRGREEVMRTRLFICCGLVVLTLAVFWQAGNCAFTNFDDPVYVTSNSHVLGGVTWEAVRWAFTTTNASNWHPLTWLSHMVDCQLYGLNPRGHHFTSLFFHIANTLLLFFLFTRMTGATWKSAFVAALFAVHPLHVESVAWVAERKDVLSAFFWFLTMFLYAGYVNKPGVARYMPVVLSFAAGLMAKPMLVTLPCVLLLMDYWPLGRVHTRKPRPAPDFGRPGAAAESRGTVSVRLLLLEKIPLFALVAISSIITFYAQRKGGAVSSLESVPFASRIINALVAWTGYIGKMIWPRNLAVFYPLDRDMSAWPAVLAGSALIVVTVLLWRTARRRPYFIVGWLWYIGTLVPVIGLVQVGMQSMADRYTYIPLTGLFIMAAWGMADFAKGWRNRQVILAVLAGVVISASTAATWRQLSYWKNSISLYRHNLSINSGNFHIHNNLGFELAGRGEYDEAIKEYQEALRINPKAEKTHCNLATELASEGKFEEAITHYKQALQIKPDMYEAYYRLAIVYTLQNKLDEAIANFNKALTISPGFPGAHFELGVVLVKQNRVEEAVYHFSEVLRLKPDSAEARHWLRTLK